MADTEAQWDKLLKIKTSGRDESGADKYRYPYEPTPYTVLERLANSGYVRKNNTLIDYGCGKGRVSFFMSREAKCRSIGIEFDERIYASAARNLETCVSGSRVTLVNQGAENFTVPEEADRCFFFNPFSVELLRKVISRLTDSLDRNPREMLLFFYYPSNEYIEFLSNDPIFSYIDEIDCRDLFPGINPRERIAIYSNSFRK